MSQQLNCRKSSAQKEVSGEFKRDRNLWRKILAVVMFVLIQLPNGLMAWTKLVDWVYSLRQRQCESEFVQRTKAPLIGDGEKGIGDKVEGQ